MRGVARLIRTDVRELRDAPEERLHARLRDLTPPISPERPAVTLTATPDAFARPQPYQKKKISPRRKARARLAVYVRDGFTCRRCDFRFEPPEGYDGPYALAAGRHYSLVDPFRFLELDHVVPERLGGKFEVANLQALCSPCNGSKGARY